MIRAALIALALLGCARPAARAPEPRERTAFCGSTCWNDAYCTGIVACSKCIGGVCSSSFPLAAAEPDDVLRLAP